LRSLLPAYSIGATDPEETRLVEQLLPRCPEASGDLQAYEQIAGSFLYAVPVVDPPSRLRQSVLEAARADMRPRRPAIEPRPSLWESIKLALFGPSGRLTAAVILAMLVLLVGTNLYWISQVTNMQTREREIAALVAQQNRELASFAQHDTQRVQLVTTDQAPFAAQAAVYWREGSGVSLFATDGLPPLEPGRTYELWLIRGEQADGVGLFQVGDDGSGALIFNSDEPISAYDAIGVTDEPEGGSVAPTSPPILLGTI
jgi:hypothetical protein